ncbi:LAFE_0A01750g1_1 [Lachancea fermentati]|uniref:Phosphotransferase n=1 Tax=Lachancea fermentati TaxID=4955 RepID=A0A1G4M6F6_LACFM|nr:LAFE_0A01750g1_1 [Lachancea fermentati]
MTTGTDILEELRDILIPKSTIKSLMKSSLFELEQRLQESSISMIPSGSDRPFKNPKNENDTFYLAIDFGGSTLKVGVVSPGSLEVSHIRTTPYVSNVVDLKFFQQLVNWICQEIAHYIKVSKANDCSIFHVSTTFSFPLNAFDEITTMGKGFIMTDDIKNVSLSEILESSFKTALAHKEFTFDVKVHGIVNDSIAVYLTNRATHRDSYLSLVLGTGINSCFPLSTEKLPPFKKSAYLQNVLINSEIGFLGHNFIQLCQHDPEQLDSQPFMPLEYVTGGKWIPLTLKKILEYYQLLPNTLLEFDGNLICQILEGTMSNVFKSHFVLVKQITQLLIERAAMYLAAVLLSIAVFIGKQQKVLNVGYVGSFLKHCEYYRSQTKLFTSGFLQLEFLENSNLIGATISTWQDLHELDDQIS